MSGTIERPVIGIIAPGEMGAAIGAAYVRAGGVAKTVLAGRGAESRARAEEAGLCDSADLDALVASSDVILSIVPPAAAVSFAEETVAAMARTGAAPAFIECNAISPEKLEGIAALFEGAGAVFVDGGIIGMPPSESARPRLYVAGGDCPALAHLDGGAFEIRSLDGPPGAASALKMCYAGVTKGVNAVLMSALLTSEGFGLIDAFMSELGESQNQLFRRTDANAPRLHADAGRWAPEMREIAASFASRGLPGEIHEGAARLYETLDRSPIGQETRRTLDPDRSAAQTAKIIGDDIRKRRG